jgi:NADH-quinone oxidoreductase subunit C
MTTPSAAITKLEELQDRTPLKELLAWNRAAVAGAKLDRQELTVYLERQFLVEAASLLRDGPELRFNYLSDITCVDWYPSEPRFEVVYHLLSLSTRQRVRLKVKLQAGDARVPSLTTLWPSANFFEREVLDLFGIEFEGHPHPRRIMMPDDWQGHPLRKDYPVEGYR